MPGKLGFGSRLIRETIDYDLGGSVEVDYAETGLTARIWISSRFLRVSSGPGAEDVTVFPDDSPLEALDVLLVEDQSLIAMDTEDLLMRSVRAACDPAPALTKRSRQSSNLPPTVLCSTSTSGHEHRSMSLTRFWLEPSL